MSIQSQLTRIDGEKNRFEQLNADLGTVINSLPNAGGGGGGGGVETCTVNVRLLTMGKSQSINIIYQEVNAEGAIQATVNTMSCTKFGDAEITFTGLRGGLIYCCSSENTVNSNYSTSITDGVTQITVNSKCCFYQIGNVESAVLGVYPA